MDNAIKLMKNAGTTVLFAGESWSNAYRERMERDWGITFCDRYGTSEVGDVGMECPERTGMHCWEDMVIAEIVDPETGGVLGPGQLGEIVVTPLWQEALPVVRYRTGDVAEYSRVGRAQRNPPSLGGQSGGFRPSEEGLHPPYRRLNWTHGKSCRTQ